MGVRYSLRGFRYCFVFHYCFVRRYFLYFEILFVKVSYWKGMVNRRTVSVVKREKKKSSYRD